MSAATNSVHWKLHEWRLHLTSYGCISLQAISVCVWGRKDVSIACDQAHFNQQGLLFCHLSSLTTHPTACFTFKANMGELHIKIPVILDPYSHLLHLVANCLPQNFELLGPFASGVPCRVQESWRRNNPDFNHLISQIIRPLIFITVPLKYLIDNGPAGNVWLSFCIPDICLSRIRNLFLDLLLLLALLKRELHCDSGTSNSLILKGRKQAEDNLLSRHRPMVAVPLLWLKQRLPLPHLFGARHTVVVEPHNQSAMLWACWPARLPSCSTRLIGPTQ